MDLITDMVHKMTTEWVIQPTSQTTDKQPTRHLFICDPVVRHFVDLLNQQVMAPCSLEFRQTYDVEKAVREMTATLSSVRVFLSATVMAMAWDLVSLMQLSTKQVCSFLCTGDGSS